VSYIAHLESLSRQIRGRVVEMSHRARAPHLGSSLSVIDILVASYWHALKIDPQNPTDPLRDRFILSKGHAAAALYATLALRGFFPAALLSQYNENGSSLPEQPAPGALPGVEAATGSLGHGLSLGVGMALAGRIQKQDYRVLVVLSDGECNEGSTWEAALYAPAHQLDNLVVVVDFNKWQATGRSEEVTHLTPLRDKWAAFGWHTAEINGNDMAQVVAALDDAFSNTGKPTAIVAHTIKGRGVSFMEDDNNWHYRIPTEEEVQAAHRELGL
jgi:transketolase